MEQFTLEELYLMRIFDTSSREALRNALLAGLYDVDTSAEPELLSLFGSTLEKLDNLTDEEFARLPLNLI